MTQILTAANFLKLYPENKFFTFTYDTTVSETDFTPIYFNTPFELKNRISQQHLSPNEMIKIDENGCFYATNLTNTYDFGP